MTTTTQNAFHPMRGHVADGTTVLMNDNTVWTISASMRGWKITDSAGRTIGTDLSAYQVADEICSAD
jgi:hypothetical protein